MVDEVDSVFESLYPYSSFQPRPTLNRKSLRASGFRDFLSETVGLPYLGRVPSWLRTMNGRDMHHFRRLILVVVLSAICGCAKTPGPESGTEPSAAPAITGIWPSKGPAGDAYPIEVTLEGRGFAESGNVVIFGDIPSAPLDSSEGGTRITFWVPKEVPSTGEVPPMILSAGEYEITVTTPAGTSGSVRFTLTRGE